MRQRQNRRSSGGGATHAADLRLSSYSILSARLRDGGYALMNGISGAVDLIGDALGRELQRGVDKGGTARNARWRFEPERVRGVPRALPAETVREFVDRGHLTQLPPEAEREMVVSIAAGAHEMLRGEPRFMFIPSWDCNYRCTYCFERPLQKLLTASGSDANRLSANPAMDERQVRAAFAGVAELQSESACAAGGQIILYGGEPLNEANQRVVTLIVERGLEAGFRFAAITNGHDLHRFLSLLGRGKIEQLQVSIDGPKQVHDLRRVHRGGESSFERVMQNARLALSTTDVEMQFRVHVDPTQVRRFAEVLTLFAEEGWLDHEQVEIYANTIYEKRDGGHVEALIDNGAVDRALCDLTRRYSNVYSSAPAVHAERTLKEAFSLGERVQVRGAFCAANTGNYIFAPDGCVYACWESVGQPCGRIGRFSEAGLELDARAVQKWFGRSIAEIEGCQQCSFALFCGGGCAQYSEYETGSPLEPHCDDFQVVFSRVLAEQVESYLSTVVVDETSIEGGQ